MKATLSNILGFSLAAAVTLSCASANAQNPEKTLAATQLTEVWKASSGLSNPESAFYDSETELIFVSNVAGAAADKDGQGWISTFSTDGKLQKGKWFSELNAPKGLGKSKGILWIADIDHIVGVEVSTQTKKYDFTISGAKFLNDIAVDEKGNVFVSDMLDNKIYKVSPSGATFTPPSVYLEGEELLKNPNGLLIDKGELIVGQWGPGIKSDFSSQELGSLIRFNVNVTNPGSLKGRFTTIAAKFGNIDGVERLDQTSFIVSDFLSGKISKVAENGKVSTLLALTSGTADIDVIPERKIVLVPHMNNSTLTAYSIK